MTKEIGPTKVKVWDPIVRIFHWVTVSIVFIDYFVFDEGDLHEALGFTLIGLLTLRFLWGFVGTKNARFSCFWPTHSRLRSHWADLKHRREGHAIGHNPIGAVMIFNLLFALSITCLTGYLGITDRFWGVEWVEETHEAAAGYLMLSVTIHVIGVLFESWRTNTNLILAMFTGIKRVKR